MGMRKEFIFLYLEMYYLPLLIWLILYSTKCDHLEYFWIKCQNEMILLYINKHPLTYQILDYSLSLLLTNGYGLVIVIIFW